MCMKASESMRRIIKYNRGKGVLCCSVDHLSRGKHWCSIDYCALEDDPEITLDELEQKVQDKVDIEGFCI